MATTIDEYLEQINVARRVDAYPLHAEMLMDTNGHPHAEELVELAGIIGFSDDPAEVQMAIANYELLFANPDAPKRKD